MHVVLLLPEAQQEFTALQEMLLLSTALFSCRGDTAHNVADKIFKTAWNVIKCTEHKQFVLSAGIEFRLLCLVPV